LTVKLSLNNISPMNRRTSSADVFQAIAHPIRRKVLDVLSQGDQPVNRLAEEFDISLPALSQQLKVLKDAGLVQEERKGRQRVYRLAPQALKEVEDWVTPYKLFWAMKLSALGQHLRRKHGKD
jgi:DNA-binding transcriptional ArsR family regulator